MHTSKEKNKQINKGAMEQKLKGVKEQRIKMQRSNGARSKETN